MNTAELAPGEPRWDDGVKANFRFVSSWSSGFSRGVSLAPISLNHLEALWYSLFSRFYHLPRGITNVCLFVGCSVSKTNASKFGQLLPTCPYPSLSATAVHSYLSPHFHLYLTSTYTSLIPPSHLTSTYTSSLLPIPHFHLHLTSTRISPPTLPTSHSPLKTLPKASTSPTPNPNSLLTYPSHPP